MNNFPSITIAFLAYNISEYVRPSLDCILNQTFKDFELLCIDDASTDGTWDILQEYAKRDNRIRLLRQKQNQGISVSRNLAVQEARGEYLLMLDGDDLFASDMVEKAYKKAKDTGADMVLWDYVVFNKEEELEGNIKEPSSLLNVTADDKVALLHRPAFMWVRLLRVEVVKRLGIQFAIGLTKQDIPIHWKLVTSIDKISILPERLSYYRQQPGSTSNRKGKSVFSLAYVMDITKKQLLEDGKYEIYKNVYLYWKLSCLHGMYDMINQEYKDEALSKVKERLGFDEWKYVYSSTNELTKKERAFYRMLQGEKWSEIKYRSYNLIRSLYRWVKKI